MMRFWNAVLRGSATCFGTPCLCLTCMRITCKATKPTSLYMNSGDLNSSPHDCVVSAWFTPWFIFLVPPLPAIMISHYVSLTSLVPYVVQDGLSIAPILLPWLPKCWEFSCAPVHPSRGNREALLSGNDSGLWKSCIVTKQVLTSALYYC